MSSHHQPEEHFPHGCFPRTPRRGTPTGTNNNNNTLRGLGSFLHRGPSGRTLLPSLFRSSQSPAPDPSSSQFLQQDPTQSHHDPNLLHYTQQGWPANQVQGHQQVVPFSSDPRFQHQQPAYGSYPPRPSPSMIGTPHDSRILPPPSLSQSQMQPHLSMSSSQIRPSSASYAAYPHYPQQHSNPYGYPAAPDPGQLPPPLSSMNPYDTSSGLSHRRPSLVERSNPMRPGAHGTSPYQRVPSATPVPEPPVEPIKKKRKRADAEQLKVLNETYNRTAFPSTEERIELAKKLGMSARSVQIWFQNKRQAMRQSSRQAAANAPPTTVAPYTPSSHATPSSATPIPSAGAYSSHPSSTMGTSSISQAGYGMGRPSSGMGGLPPSSARLNPSPAPSSQRRSREEEDSHRHDYRRYSSPRPGQF